MGFKPATKREAKIRMALCGPGGAGKTWTALDIAAAIGGSVAVIDTDKGKASLYSDIWGFDVWEVDSFNPAELPEMVRQAAGYDTLIIDTLSSYWSGTNGMLEQVTMAAKRGGGGNNFAGWNEMKPVEREMINAMLAFPGHLIATMRVKIEYEVQDNDRGKKAPRKVGTTPEQRNGIEYEFDVVADMDVDNTFIVTKSRCPALNQATFTRPSGSDVARPYLDWLSANAVPDTTVADLVAQVQAGMPADDLVELYTQVRNRGLGQAAVDGGNTTLEELIKQQGQRAREAEQKTTEQPDQAEAAVEELPEQTAWDDTQQTGEQQAPQEPPGWDMTPAAT